MLHGSVNHVSITVSDLPKAMEFFAPLLEFLGYTVGPVMHDPRSNHDLTVNINAANGTAFNIWQAETDLAGHAFEVYEPGLHHVAWNVERHEQVDAVHRLLRGLGAEILDGPAEFPFGPGGYYAVYFRGPDRLKFEIVHMPVAEQRARRTMQTIRPARPEEAGLLSGLAVRSKAYWGYSSEFMAACRDELSVSARDIEGNPTFVLEASGRVAGFYSLEQVSPTTAELTHLFVEPASIGSGCGRALIEHARSEAQRLGYQVLVIQGDPNAEGFYLAIGARRVGERESASIPGRQLPLLELSLGANTAA